MTLPSMNSERLMVVVSLSVSPADLLSRSRSLPARSTNETCRKKGWGKGGMPLSAIVTLQHHISAGNKSLGAGSLARQRPCC